MDIRHYVRTSVLFLTGLLVLLILLSTQNLSLMGIAVASATFIHLYQKKDERYYWPALAIGYLSYEVIQEYGVLLGGTMLQAVVLGTMTTLLVGRAVNKQLDQERYQEAAEA